MNLGLKIQKIKQMKLFLTCFDICYSCSICSAKAILFYDKTVQILRQIFKILISYNIGYRTATEAYYGDKTEICNTKN